jgi:hypothetical protein
MRGLFVEASTEQVGAPKNNQSAVLWSVMTMDDVHSETTGILEVRLAYIIFDEQFPHKTFVQQHHFH